MKKGIWGIEKLPSREFVLSSCGDELTKEDLKDLRSLIDTVLGEDCSHKKSALSKSTRWGTRKICNSCGQDWKKEWDSQPLTEGEGKCEKPECRARKVIFTKEYPAMEEVIQNTKWRDYIKDETQQESNKEECKNESGLCIPEDGLHFMECPSHYKNKEMPRCGGLGCKFPPQHPGACYQGERKEPSKKPVCYCGHPKERHFVQYKSLVEGNQLSCRHCECFEYADNELHNQGEI